MKVFHAGEKGVWSMLVFARNRNKARYLAKKAWPSVPSPEYIDIDVWRADDDFWLFYEGEPVIDTVVEFNIYDPYDEPTWEEVLKIRKNKLNII